MGSRILISIFIGWGVLSVTGCSEAVDSAAQTGYEKTQGRVDKARDEIGKAEELAKKKFDDAEKAIRSPSEATKQ